MRYSLVLCSLELHTVTEDSTITGDEEASDIGSPQGRFGDPQPAAAHGDDGSAARGEDGSAARGDDASASRDDEGSAVRGDDDAAARDDDGSAARGDDGSAVRGDDDGSASHGEVCATTRD